MSNETKKWYESKTLIGGVIACIALIVLAVATIFDGNNGTLEKAAKAILEIIAVCAGLLSLYGIRTAKKEIQ